MYYLVQKWEGKSVKKSLPSNLGSQFLYVNVINNIVETISSKNSLKMQGFLANEMRTRYILKWMEMVHSSNLLYI